MLLLKRKLNEQIVIGDGITITICRITRCARARNDTVSIGIQAAPEIPVHRLEVYERIQAAKDHDA